MATASPILDDNPIEVDPNLPGPGQPAPVHTILDDIANAVRDYPKNYVDLEFADIDPEVGTSINTNEEANFRIRVVNRGPLTLRDVKIRVVAKSGAKVKGNGAIDPLDGEAFANPRRRRRPQHRQPRRDHADDVEGACRDEACRYRPARGVYR